MMTSHFNIDRNFLPYRKGVGIMLLNNSLTKVFVGQRIDQFPGVEAWQMPQGGIDEGESPTEAALRELYEEVGTNEVTLLGQTKSWFSYDLPDEWIAKLWNGQFRGQQQIWFLMSLKGE